MLTIQSYNNLPKSHTIPVSKSPSFRSNYEITRSILTNGRITKNATWFFRDDLNWKSFCNLILKTSKNDKKVHIVCVPCSDGTEPTSLLLKLWQLKKYRNNPDKFGKIRAYDIDDNQLEIAKSGRIPLINNPNLGIFDSISLLLNIKKDIGKNCIIKDGRLELAKDLKDKIAYEKQDIADVVENLPKDEKVVLLIRNIFPYIDDMVHIPRVLKGLSKLKIGSIVAIGNYDKKVYSNIDDYIIAQGYKKAGTKNCFIKI